MPQLPRFRHEPLQRPGDKRVLVVQGADRLEDELELELWHSPALKDSRPHLRHAVLVEDHVSMVPMTYEAVSYAWAQKDDQVPVRVLYGRKMYAWNIGRSVETMIKYLRFPKGQCRQLWVDALCIRQEGKGEKEKQVHRMGEIYEGAERVLIWLGTDDQYNDGGIQTLHEIAKYSRIFTNSKPPFDTRWTADKFLRRRWFSRLWVIQKVALARKAIVICGQRDRSRHFK